jgi:hypothetical protein
MRPDGNTVLIFSKYTSLLLVPAELRCMHMLFSLSQLFRAMLDSSETNGLPVSADQSDVLAIKFLANFFTALMLLKCHELYKREHC